MSMKKSFSLNQGTSIFLRLAMLGMAGFVLLMSILFVPNLHREWPLEVPEHANWRYVLIFAIIVSTVSFFIALFQISKLLSLIDRNKAFSKASVKAMGNVKRCGLTISGLFMLCLPAIFQLAQADDAPGLILIFGFIFVCIPLMVGVLAGVAQRLFQNAIDIKSENDLTV